MYLSLVVHIGEGSFERVFRSAYSFVVNKDTPEEDHVVRTLYISANDRDLLELNQTTISRIFENRGTDIRQELFKHDDGVRLLIGLKEIDLEIINQMESDYIDWDAYFTDSRGVELGKRGLVIRCRECGKWQPAPDNFPRRPVQQIRCHSCDEVFTSSDDLSKTIVGDTRVNRNYKKILFGEDVNRYYTTQNKYIDTSYDGVNYKNASLYTGTKLLVRKTSVGVYASLDIDGCLTNQVTFIFKGKPELPDDCRPISLAYVLAIISSRLMQYYHAAVNLEREWRSFPYITQRIIKSFPIRNPESLGQRGWETHDRLTDIVLNVTEQRGQISSSQDLEIEELVREVYGVTDEQGIRVDQFMTEEMQRLRIVRELYDVTPDSLFRSE